MLVFSWKKKFSNFTLYISWKHTRTQTMRWINRLCLSFFPFDNVFIFYLQVFLYSSKSLQKLLVAHDDKIQFIVVNLPDDFIWRKKLRKKIIIVLSKNARCRCALIDAIYSTGMNGSFSTISNLSNRIAYVYSTYAFGLECALIQTHQTTHTYTCVCKASWLLHVHKFLCAVCIRARHTVTNLKKRLFGLRTESQTVSKYTPYMYCIYWCRFSEHKIAFVCVCAHTQRLCNGIFRFFFIRNQTPIHWRHAKWKSSRFEMVRTISFRIQIRVGFFFLTECFRTPVDIFEEKNLMENLKQKIEIDSE